MWVNGNNNETLVNTQQFDRSMVDPTSDPKRGRNKIITLCGSMKYWNEFLRIGAILSEQGNIVLTPFRQPMSEEMTQEEKEARHQKLLELQFKRIDRSDSIFVINKDGYIGKSTQQEIDYATRIPVNVEYLEPIKIYPVVTLIGSGKFKSTFDMVEVTMSQKGFIVLTPEIFKHPQFFSPDFRLTTDQHRVYDELHQQKMLASDFVVLIAENGYVGKDTQKEIDFCRIRGIPVRNYEDALTYEPITAKRNQEEVNHG